ncbi:MarR family transcriptional regulator [Streptomyces sp. NPDC057638]|uniref:MarR family transcriptional regulator n=1 Tax=Streptomyces sp. NPDC057638 TaxID=3346190 RepID=UPI0036ADD67A
MPGGRLTQEDRRRIAAWLEDGLGYAEIGRRLGRPTSTISREVARNGDSGAYRAAHAQRAADRRARRPGPPRAAGPEPGERLTEEARAFADEFAATLTATGLPRMTARVLVTLLTADTEGLTAADLVRRLQVSPASVSLAIGSLEAMDLVARRADPGTRRERYEIDEESWLRVWHTDTGAHGEVAAEARRGAALFGADTVAGARLGAMARFFARLSDHMGGSALGEATVDDAFTVLAALVHTDRPLTVGVLAAALDWPAGRVATALDAVRLHPALADPLALCVLGGPGVLGGPAADVPGGTGVPGVPLGRMYAVTVSPDRLSPAQRAALDRRG